MYRFSLFKTFRLSITLLCLAASTGCSLIFGGDQRVDNKSHDYTVVRLDHDADGGWRVLPPPAKSTKKNPQPGAAVPEDTGDVAFENQKSGAIISVDSVCNEYRDVSLDDLTRYLLMGLNTQGQVQSHDVELDGGKAQESTVQAAMLQRLPAGEAKEYPVQVRAVVLKKNGCVYDLMYIARPSVYEEYKPSFERFLKGFHAQ